MRRLPAAVERTVDALVSELGRLLGHGLTGVYLRGSIATGDFIPETSDIDVLVAVERAAADATFGALKAVHDRLARSHDPYGNRLEAAYIDRAMLRRFRPGLRFPTLGQGECLEWTEHRANWIIERWTVREHGLALVGPPARSLIDPVPASELVEATRQRLADWEDWLRDPDDAGWREPRRGHMAYVIETMCRCLYTLRNAEVPSKESAVAWALKTMAPPWREIVKLSQVWRTEHAVDRSLVPGVRRFVAWAVEQRHSPGAVVSAQFRRR